MCNEFVLVNFSVPLCKYFLFNVLKFHFQMCKLFSIQDEIYFLLFDVV